jgi:hypothetical protein
VRRRRGVVGVAAASQEPNETISPYAFEAGTSTRARSRALELERARMVEPFDFRLPDQ